MPASIQRESSRVSTYSFRKNLSFMALAVSRPRQLLDEFRNETCFWYGAIPFIICSLANSSGALLAYVRDYQQPISPMPKLLPIPDTHYLLFQAFVGPLIKLVGIFIFAGSLELMSRLLRLPAKSNKQIVLFSVLIDNTIGLLAFAVDQLITWSQVQGSLRFLLSTVHPVAFIVDVVYTAAFVVRQTAASPARALALVMPGLIIGGTVLGIFFR